MDPATIAIGVGLAASLALTELFGLVAGGMVVPGYLALFLHRPLVVTTTIGAALLTWAVVRYLSRHMIVYGRRRTSLMILVGFLIGFSLRAAIVAAGDVQLPGSLQTADFSIVGYIIPGLIAIWIDRQGVVETLAVVLTASAIVRLLLIACGVELYA